MTQVPKVLIIDDDSTIRKLFSKQLEHIGVEVITTDCASEGIDIIENERPAITFVDFLMPKMNGDEMLIKISEKKLFHCSSFYLYTAKDLDSTETFKLMTLGFTHILKKPIDSNELLAILIEEGAVLAPAKAA